MTLPKPVKQGELENAGSGQGLCFTELEALRARAENFWQPLGHKEEETC